MKYLVPLVYILIGAALFHFVYPKKTKVVTVYKQYKPPKGFVLIKKVELDSLTKEVDIKSDSISKLVRKYRKTVSLVMSLRVEVDSLKRTNLSPTDTTDTTYTYDDSIITIGFNTKRKLFSYLIKPYPFYIDIATFGDTLVAVDVSHLGQSVRKTIHIAKPVKPEESKKQSSFGGFFMGIFLSNSYVGAGLGLKFRDYFGSLFLMSTKSLGFSLMKKL